MKCCDYTAGMLKHSITFQRETLVGDDAGGTTSTWAAIVSAPTRGFIKAMSGNERWASARVEATASYRLVVRYFPNLMEKDRVLFRDRAHNIRFVNNVEFADKWLEIDLSEGVAT